MALWDRITLKMRAKEILKKTYWMSFLVMFIMGILGGGVNYSWTVSIPEDWRYYAFSDANLSNAILAIAPVVTGIAIAASCFGIVFNIFVSSVFEVGKCRFFTLARYGSDNIDSIIFGFKNGKYMSNVKTMFMKNLYVFLWSLLFVIPGIIKELAYFMVPYIIAENPNISTERALEISERTTNGEKGDIFILKLSFIGWYLLGILACGIGVLFVNPYYEATCAELYGALRLKAVTLGICSKEEIGAEL